MKLTKAANSVLKEDSLLNRLTSELGVKSNIANAIVQGLDFSTYVAVNRALVDGDKQEAAKLLGIEEQPVDETEQNAYTAARKGPDADGENQQPQGSVPQGSTPIDITDLDIGSELDTDQGVAKVSKVDKIGDTTTLTTNKNTQLSISDNPQLPQVDLTNKDDAEAEIDRIKKLAGIESGLGEEGTGRPGGFKGGAIAAAACSGTVMGPNKIKKLTSKPKKPGPKPSEKTRK